MPYAWRNNSKSAVSIQASSEQSKLPLGPAGQFIGVILGSPVTVTPLEFKVKFRGVTAMVRALPAPVTICRSDESIVTWAVSLAVPETLLKLTVANSKLPAG